RAALEALAADPAHAEAFALLGELASAAGPPPAPPLPARRRALDAARAALRAPARTLPPAELVALWQRLEQQRAMLDAALRPPPLDEAARDRGLDAVAAALAHADRGDDEAAARSLVAALCDDPSDAHAQFALQAAL